MKWVERRSQIDYRAHEPGQLVCHIPNNEVITTKIGLLSTLRAHFCRVSIGSQERKATPWLPETYQLDIPVDVNTAIDINQKLCDEAAAQGARGPIWIYKPSSNNRGRGIKVLSGVDDVREVCIGKVADGESEAVKPLPGIIQRYIENPLLVRRGDDGFKFDYRCYMLIARNTPGHLVFFHPGYCRLTTKPYSDTVESLADPTIHLTNASVQKKDTDYKDNKEWSIQSLEDIARNAEEYGNTASAEFLRTEFHEQIKKCMVDVHKSSACKYMKKAGYFDLFGLDFMVTTDNKVLLLEANTNPALSLDNECLQGILPDMVDGCIELVLGAQGPQRPLQQTDKAFAESDAMLLSNIPGNWTLLHDEKKKMYYRKPKESSVKMT